MTTEILDVEGLLGLVVDDPTPWSGIHPETDIGHLHIQVADLERAERFYHSTLGFDITQRDYPGARFLSAGGYHHHIGLNVWAGVGAPNPPADAVGLVSFSLQLPDEGALTALEVWLEDSGVTIETGLNGRGGRVIGLLDPDGNKVILRA
jgi:catechol 2,3-dioxygenase